jgi:threonine/homoserine/homoserine lactone efflux protein
VYTTTCFGLVYWPSSGYTVNLTRSYTICAWGTVGGNEISSDDGQYTGPKRVVVYAVYILVNIYIYIYIYIYI